MAIIQSENDSAVVTAINQLGDRFAHDIAQLGERLDKAVERGNDSREAQAAKMGKLEARVDGLSRIVWWMLGGGGAGGGAMAVAIALLALL